MTQARTRKTSAKKTVAKKTVAKKTVAKKTVAKKASGATTAERPRQRLAAAFAALNAMGIVALENAGTTQSDGWDDVNEIATKRLQETKKRPKGGAFYHGQDAKRGKRGEGVFITFGAYVTGPKRDAASLEVAKKIVAVLKEHGFEPKWNGTLAERVHTGPFEWK